MPLNAHDDASRLAVLVGSPVQLAVLISPASVYVDLGNRRTTAANLVSVRSKASNSAMQCLKNVFIDAQVWGAPDCRLWPC